MFGRVRTKVYRGHLLGKYPTDVFCVRNFLYGLNTLPTEHSGMVRYELDAGTPTLRYVRYDLNTGTRHFGKFGTT